MGFTFQASDIGALISVALMVLGVRLLRMAWRDSSAPELLIGAYLFLSPPATSLTMRIPRFDPAYQELLQNIGALGLAISGACLAGFAWRVFRPDAVWAKCSAVSALVLLVGVSLIGAFAPDRVGAELRAVVVRVLLLSIYFWLWIECHLHRRLLGRRLRLGLADPVVVNRFLLFEVWIGVLALLPGLTLFVAAQVNASGFDLVGSLFAVVVRITGLFIYGAIWLSFLPPQAYTRWVRRKHQERCDSLTAETAGV